MSLDEVSAILKARETARRETWEQVRTLCHYEIKFPWDKKESQGRKLSEGTHKKRLKKAEKYINNGRR
jgi:hypothetical protein